EGHVWVVPAGKGAILALGPGVATSEFETVTWTDVPLPPGAVRAARFRSPAELYDALRRELLSNVVDRGLVRRRPSARLDLAAPACCHPSTSPLLAPGGGAGRRRACASAGSPCPAVCRRRRALASSSPRPSSPAAGAARWQRRSRWDSWSSDASNAPRGNRRKRAACPDPS